MGSRNAFTSFGLYINILLGIFLLGSSFAGFSQTGGAEKWPVRPIKMVIPFSAGGPLDHLARKIGQKLTDALGANVVIDNRAGANGIIGSDHVAKSLADGYTMLFMTGSFTANPALYKKLPFDPIKDFIPVTQVGRSYGLVLVVNNSFSVQSLKDLIALSKTRTGQLNYASGGQGNLTHLAGELFNHLANIQMLHIPYKGSGPAMTDVLAKQVDMTFVSTVGSIQAIKEKRVIPMAISSSIRVPTLPEIPTFTELGFKEMEQIYGWYGIWYPTGTPADRVEKVQNIVQQFLKHPDIKTHFDEIGLIPVGSSSSEFAQFITEDIMHQNKLFKIAKVVTQ